MGDQTLTEWEKMQRGTGLPYKPLDPKILTGKLRPRKLLKDYNDHPLTTYDPTLPLLPQCFPSDKHLHILADLFGIPLEKAKLLYIEQPFQCDYGINIKFKGIAYMNFNCTVLYLDSPDNCAQVTIGNRVLFGPNVNIFSSTHSTDVVERRACLGRAYPVTIGDDVWIGGNATLIGPCTIGNGVTVAAGAVVKGNFPDNVVIGGVPAKILKHLDPPPPFPDEVEMSQTVGFLEKFKLLSPEQP